MEKSNTCNEYERYFCKCVKRQSDSDAIMDLLHRYIDGQSKPKGIMRPIRAAIEAGAIMRPDRDLFNRTFGKNVSKSRFNEYSNPQNIPDVYARSLNDFNIIVEEFRKIVKG